MSESRTAAAASPSLLEIELSAAARTFETTRLAAADGMPAGLLLLRRDLAPEDLQCVQTALQSLHLDAGKNSYRPCCQEIAPSSEVQPLATCSFTATLEQELSKVTASRLPCSLILLQIGLSAPDDRVSPAAEPAAYIAQHLHPGEIHGRPNADTYGIILPATGLGRARSRAEQLRDVVLVETRNNAAMYHHLALVTCKVGHGMRGDDFIRAASELLQRDRTHNDMPTALFPVQEDVSCQVTVEERAHLFRFMD